MSTKITVIGAGSVGSAITNDIMVQGIASEVVLIDINKEKAMGEALDIRQGTPFCGSCSIYAGSYVDAKDSDIVIITSGVARKPGQTRLDLAQINVNVIKSIAPQITKYAPNATYVIVSNPVDILTYAFTKLFHHSQLFCQHLYQIVILNTNCTGIIDCIQLVIHRKIVVIYNIHNNNLKICMKLCFL